MVIDTACMRMVAGLEWLQLHLSRLQTMGYDMAGQEERESFVFGDAEPV